jgi:putative membrane protein
MSVTGDGSYNERNELAKERNRAAADRTLLAWIRTSLALIAFGFGIDRIVNVINAQAHISTGLTAVVGLGFMALGIYAVVTATYSYRRQLALLARSHYTYQEGRPFAMIVAVVLALIGSAAFIGILVQAVHFGLNR